MPFMSAFLFNFLKKYLFDCNGSQLLVMDLVVMGINCSYAVVMQLNCPVACGILLPEPGIEPMSPALEGGVLTTGLSGKSPASMAGMVWK